MFAKMTTTNKKSFHAKTWLQIGARWLCYLRIHWHTDTMFYQCCPLHTTIGRPTFNHLNRRMPILEAFLAKRNGNIKIRIFAENVRVVLLTEPEENASAHSDGYDDINCY